FRGWPPRRRPVTRAGGPARSVRGPGRGRGRATTSAGPCRRCPSRDSPATRPHGRPTIRAAPGWGASGAPCPPSQREVGAELVRCDVPPVVLPLATLVAEEELEDVLAEGLGHEFGLLHRVERILEVAGQIRVAHRAPLTTTHGPHVVLGLRRQLVALLDALGARRHPHRVGEGGVARRTGAPVVRGGALAGPGRGPGCVAPYPRDDRPGRVRRLVLVVRVVGGVGVALEQAHVGVHGGAGVVTERLGHDRRPHAVVHSHLLDDVPERHDVVGHTQRVRVPQVDLLLPGSALVVGELHGDAHRLERLDGVPTDGAEPVPTDSGGYFDQAVHDTAPHFRRHAIEALEAMGISVEFSHHEGAPGQQEIDLRYADALSMADNIMTFRYVVKEVAMNNGVWASFMPKPLRDHPGSAMHTHMSLFEGDTNAFHDPDDEYQLSDTARSFVAGILRH